MHEDADATRGAHPRPGGTAVLLRHLIEGRGRQLDEPPLALEEPEGARRLGEEHVGAGRVTLLGDLQGQLVAAGVAHGDVDVAALPEAVEERGDELLAAPAVHGEAAVHLLHLDGVAIERVRRGRVVVVAAAGGEEQRGGQSIRTARYMARHDTDVAPLS